MLKSVFTGKRDGDSFFNWPPFVCHGCRQIVRTDCENSSMCVSTSAVCLAPADTPARVHLRAHAHGSACLLIRTSRRALYTYVHLHRCDRAKWDAIIFRVSRCERFLFTCIRTKVNNAANFFHRSTLFSFQVLNIKRTRGSLLFRSKNFVRAYPDSYVSMRKTAGKRANRAPFYSLIQRSPCINKQMQPTVTRLSTGGDKRALERRRDTQACAYARVYNATGTCVSVRRAASAHRPCACGCTRVCVT